MPAPAEANEGRGRVINLRPAGTLPEIPPIVFEGMNVVTRRGVPSLFIGFIGQRRERLAIRGQGTLNPFAVAIEEDDHIGLFIENEPIVRQVIVQGDFFDVLAKPLH